MLKSSSFADAFLLALAARAVRNRSRDAVGGDLYAGVWNLDRGMDGVGRDARVVLGSLAKREAGHSAGEGELCCGGQAVLENCLRAYINKIFVDESWYLDAHPDVADAVRQGVIKTAKDHYVAFGYTENRQPYNMTVEEDWYLDQYRDVREAVESGVFGSAQEHFNTVGYKEGRHPHPAFALKTVD